MLNYSVDNHEDETFRKTPLQWAEKNHDIETLLMLINADNDLDTGEVKAILRLIGLSPKTLDTDDTETLKSLIDHKVRHAHEPQTETFPLNITVERDEKKKDVIKDIVKDVVKELEFCEDEDDETSFIDKFFPPGSRDIREKLDSLMSHEWEEEEENRFHHIILAAATCMKRHDIVDVILHKMSEMDSKELHRDYSVSAC